MCFFWLPFKLSSYGNPSSTCLISWTFSRPYIILESVIYAEIMAKYTLFSFALYHRVAALTVALWKRSSPDDFVHVWIDELLNEVYLKELAIRKIGFCILTRVLCSFRGSDVNFSGFVSYYWHQSFSNLFFLSPFQCSSLSSYYCPVFSKLSVTPLRSRFWRVWHDTQEKTYPFFSCPQLS